MEVTQYGVVCHCVPQWVDAMTLHCSCQGDGNDYCNFIVTEDGKMLGIRDGKFIGDVSGELL